MKFVQDRVKAQGEHKQSVVWEEAFTDATEIPLLNGTIDPLFTHKCCFDANGLLLL
jgi:hypothetical protein